ncbi:replicative DNA helicase [Peribacillus frigoritolerans]|uniref:replicative DNA helicase n=1 Tax=Peribacillus frigoritolerans TaxID=450367 RepID=UPI0022808A4C|nr:replicative DNA helicase [Peribacillus frigoritolerans]MCY9003301.1 replicative DNA helicase [Peribacillus frigoritolerans]
MEEQLLYNLEVEKSYLGILLAEPGLIKDAKIKPFQLSPGKNFNVLWTLQDLDEKGIPIDFVTVMERVGRKNIEKIGGPDYLGDLAASVPSTASFTYYEKVLHEYWQRREAITIANQIKESALSGEPPVVIQTGINNLMRLEDNSTDDDDGSIKDDLVAVYDELETPKGEITGMPTGFTELDRMTAGLQKQDLIVIAARPSVGKTAFALNIAEGVAKQKQFAVGFFSLEMGRKQLLKRMISSNGRINAQHIRTSNLVDKDWGKLTGAMGDVSNLNLRIFDNPGITVNQIWAKVRKMKRDFEGKDILVIIDYLQLITGSTKHKGNRMQEISEISRMLKHLARELDVCVIALSQLSRAVEQRQDKRPMMSDIRESGQIEQDADVIGFLYRDDYYDKESESKNIIEIIIGKQRNGPIGTISLAFIKEYGVFLNLERRHDG